MIFRTEKVGEWSLYHIYSWTVVYNNDPGRRGLPILIEVRHTCSSHFDSGNPIVPSSRQGYDTGKYIRCSGCNAIAPKIVKFAYRALRM